jgi:poly-beta-hydroxyalkanoate depolymerase
MDRSIVSKSSYEEADNHTNFYDDKTPKERLEAAYYIIKHVFQKDENYKMDKTITYSRKHAKSI